MAIMAVLLFVGGAFVIANLPVLMYAAAFIFIGMSALMLATILFGIFFVFPFLIAIVGLAIGIPGIMWASAPNQSLTFIDYL